MVIYEVFTRNHGRSGTFKDVYDDLERIKNLGADVIWLMPIYPIGKKHRKGKSGSPYSIRNHKGINTQYGTLNDFLSLLGKIHELGMMCMLDIVFNHTSHDSDLYDMHPEYFLNDADGRPCSKIEFWKDIIDLDYSKKELWKVMTDILKYWVNLGVDGFRCDVASLVPIEFWIYARGEISALKDDIIWLAETVELNFADYVRKRGYEVTSDKVMYDAFDVIYDYEMYPLLKAYLKGELQLEEYINRLREQERKCVDNEFKIRFLENHDVSRICSYIDNIKILKAWTAFMLLQKGPVLIYSGQEVLARKAPDLFDVDSIKWTDRNSDFIEFITALIQIKKLNIVKNGDYSIHNLADKGTALITYRAQQSILTGIFNLDGRPKRIKTAGLSDGILINLLDSSRYVIQDGSTFLDNAALVFLIE